MTKSEKDIIDAINYGCGNPTVKKNKNVLFIYKNNILQNFAILLEDVLILRIDNNCKGIYKKILKHHGKLNKPIIFGTDIVSKISINKFTVEDTIYMIGDLFQYCDTQLLTNLEKNNLSLKDIIYNTAEYFNIGEYYYGLINESRNFERIKHIHSSDYDYVNMIYHLSKKIENEFNQSEWLNHYREKIRDDMIFRILEG